MAKNRRVIVDLDPFMQATKVISAAIALSLDSAGGVSLPQLRALAMIDRRESLNLTAVAEGLGVNRSNASRACERLVARGLVERTEDPDDRRNVLLRLSPAGRRILATMMNRRRAVLSGVVARMSPEDQDALHVAMLAFSAAADELSANGELLSDGDGHLMRWLG